MGSDFFCFWKKCLLVHPNIQSLSVSTVSTVSTSFRVDFGAFFRFFRVLWLHIYSSWIQIQMEQYNGGISNRVFLLTWKSGILTQDARLKVTSQVDRGTWLGYIPTRFIAIQQCITSLSSSQGGPADGTGTACLLLLNPILKSKNGCIVNFLGNFNVTEYLNAGCVKSMVTLQSGASVEFAQVLQTNWTLCWCLLINNILMQQT